MAKKKTIVGPILTDVHLSSSNRKAVISLFKQTAQWVLKNFNGKDQMFIYLTGDAFDARKAQTIDVLVGDDKNDIEGFLEILDYLQTLGIKIIAIPGNHDKRSYTSKRSYLDVFRNHPALELYSEAAIVRETKEYAVSMIPFFADEEYLEQLNRLPAAKAPVEICLTHIGIDAAKMNNGTVVSSDITAKTFKRFDYVAVGHYHDPQELADGKIQYIGASLQHNFGEGVNKGLMVLYSDLSGEIISLDFPQYLTYTLSVDQANVAQVKAIKAAANENQVRIVVTGKNEEIKSLNKKELEDLGVKITKKPEEISESELIVRSEPFNSQSLGESFAKFCEERQLNVEVGRKYFDKINFAQG